jgi:hypothetical protein
MNKFCLLLPLIVAVSLWGQAPSADADKQNTDADQQNKDTGQSSKNAGTSKSRLFFAIPNFLTVQNAGKVPPLTTGQKFWVTTRGTFDPVTLAWYGALAGISQAQDNQERYGQGVEGFAKRYGVRFADGTIENYMVKALAPTLLHQDPRYFELGKGGFWHRLGYAVGRIFVTRSDSGASQFNYSEVFGAAAAAAISTYTYHPRDERNLSNVINIWGTQVAWDTFGYVVKEFWPDIHHLLRKSPPAQTH